MKFQNILLFIGLFSAVAFAKKDLGSESENSEDEQPVKKIVKTTTIPVVADAKVTTPVAPPTGTKTTPPSVANATPSGTPISGSQTTPASGSQTTPAVKSTPSATVPDDVNSKSTPPPSEKKPLKEGEESEGEKSDGYGDSDIKDKAMTSDDESADKDVNKLDKEEEKKESNDNTGKIAAGAGAAAAAAAGLFFWTTKSKKQEEEIDSLRSQFNLA